MDSMISLVVLEINRWGVHDLRGIIQEAVTMNKTNAPDFKNYFFDWMGDEEQIDDVLVIGFKL